MKGAVGALADLCLTESDFPSCSCQLKGSASSPEMGNQSCKNSPRVSSGSAANCGRESRSCCAAGLQQDQKNL